MQMPEKILQGAYALSIAWLSYSIVTTFAQYIHLEDLYLFFFLGTIGAFLLMLGLFKFQKGFSAGLTFAGIGCALKGAAHYIGNLDDYLRFVLAVAMLLIAVYALYQLKRQDQGK